VRLARLPHFLQSHPRGLTAAELAALCGVSCRTLQRDLLTLQVELRLPLEEHSRRYSLAGDYILPPVSFTLCESVALFLAARLLVRQTDEWNPRLESALVKMAKALPETIVKKALESIALGLKKPEDPGFVAIFERVALAWTTRRELRFSYQSSASEEYREWLLRPYYMEMTGVGFSCYVIGYGMRTGKEYILTFKLDRIKDPVLTENNYEIPPDVDIGKKLATSWGVIWGDGAELLLKFSPAVTRRVKESRWHPSQQITDLPQGGCLLRLNVGSLLEITPWIRGWGPDVEVLEPKELREQMRGWAEKLGRMYGGE